MQSYTLPARLLAGDPGPWSARLAFQVQRQAQDVAWEEGLPKGHGGGWRCRPFLLILCCVFPLIAEGSWAHLLPWGPVDLVVSNPPYVFSQDMEQLAPEIRRCGVGWDREARPERPSGLGLPRRPTPSEGRGVCVGRGRRAVLRRRCSLGAHALRAQLPLPAEDRRTFPRLGFLPPKGELCRALGGLGDD